MHLSTFVMIGLLLGAELPAQPLPTDTFELRLRQLPPPALPPFALSEYRLVSKTRNSGQGPYGLPVDTSLTLGSLVGEGPVFLPWSDLGFHGERHAILVRDIPVSLLDRTVWIFERRGP